MTQFICIPRLVTGLAFLATIVRQFDHIAGRAEINPFNFFGYFTIQRNIITMGAFLASAYLIFSRKPQLT